MSAHDRLNMGGFESNRVKGRRKRSPRIDKSGEVSHVDMHTGHSEVSDGEQNYTIAYKSDHTGSYGYVNRLFNPKGPFIGSLKRSRKKSKAGANTYRNPGQLVGKYQHLREHKMQVDKFEKDFKYAVKVKCHELLRLKQLIGWIDKCIVECPELREALMLEYTTRDRMIEIMLQSYKSIKGRR